MSGWSRRSRLPSPTNKESSGRGEYLQKRHRLRREGVNLVEIDLLIAGQRPAMARPAARRGPSTSPSSARATRGETAEVYAWSLQQALPRIPIPLEDPDPDVFLDLAGIFALAYERGRYGRLIDYSRPLRVPVPSISQDRAWAESVACGTARKP